ncbi:MAG: hypothetical protein AB7J13_09520 [Pyrinomonadaceae bacterium]
MAVTAVISACGGPAANTNTTANTTNSANTANTKKEEVAANNAPTLTPVFKAFCEAWVKNDEAALRRVYSSDTIKKFEEEMKEEKAKNLITFLESTDRVSGTPCEVTNEKITGDEAIATIKSDKYPNGIDIVFIKESGEWKMTTRAPTLNSVKPVDPAKESNTANGNTSEKK